MREKFLHIIEKDRKRYGEKWLFHAGFWVVFSYRVRRLRKHGPRRYIMLLPVDIILGFVRWILSDTAIPSSVTAGAGLYLPHPNGVVIGSRVGLGENVAIFQQVTLGEWHERVPTIGDYTSLFAGAKIFGGVNVGNHCKIGANAVVNIDVPDNTSVSVGTPVFRKRS